jgi:hypothetical protein
VDKTKNNLGIHFHQNAQLNLEHFRIYPGVTGVNVNFVSPGFHQINV